MLIQGMLSFGINGSNNQTLSLRSSGWTSACCSAFEMISYTLAWSYIDLWLLSVSSNCSPEARIFLD
jgi:hypothetical protein